MPIHTSPELRSQIRKLEEELGVSKTDRPEYQQLTDLQYHYVLTRCLRGGIMNKAQWSRDTDTDQSYIYRLQASDKVAAAMGCLSNAKGKIRLNELSDIAFQKACEGDVKWAKLYIQMHGYDKETEKKIAPTIKIDWSQITGEESSETSIDQSEKDNDNGELDSTRTKVN